MKNYIVKYIIKGKVNFDLDSNKKNNLNLIKEKIMNGELGEINDIEIDEIFKNETIENEEKCPHCDVPLVSKVFDVDGTNLSEHKVCPDCGYGTPPML